MNRVLHDLTSEVERIHKRVQHLLPDTLQAQTVLLDLECAVLHLKECPLPECPTVTAELCGDMLEWPCPFCKIKAFSIREYLPWGDSIIHRCGYCDRYYTVARGGL